MASRVYIRLGLGFEVLQETNSLAYFAVVAVMKKKIVIVLTPGACTIKLFTAVIYGFS
jgi:hypothetical protein